MSKATNKLKSILEAWEQAGDQTEYGKSKDLPKIDYWRRVGGQNIGFVGKEGEGVPVTGFSANREAVAGAADDAKGTYASVPNDAESYKNRDLFRKKLGMLGDGGYQYDDYLRARDTAKLSFDALMSDVLAKNGLTKQEFEKILASDSDYKDEPVPVDSKLSKRDREYQALLNKVAQRQERLKKSATRNPKVVKVFADIRSRVLEENRKKFGTPKPDGSTFGLGIAAPMKGASKEAKVRMQQMLAEFQTLMGHSLQDATYPNGIADAKKFMKDLFESKDGKVFESKLRQELNEFERKVNTVIDSMKSKGEDALYYGQFKPEILRQEVEKVFPQNGYSPEGVPLIVKLLLRAAYPSKTLLDDLINRIKNNNDRDEPMASLANADDIISALKGEKSLSYFTGILSSRLPLTNGLPLQILQQSYAGIMGSKLDYPDTVSKMKHQDNESKTLSVGWNDSYGRANFADARLEKDYSLGGSKRVPNKIKMFDRKSAENEFVSCNEDLSSESVTKGSDTVFDGEHKATLFHEMTHWTESYDQDLYASSMFFLKNRILGDSEGSDAEAKLSEVAPKSLQKIYKGDRYGSDEYAYTDEFTTAYIGKVYSDQSSEVATMGVQEFSYPERMAALYRDDKDFFYHTFGVVTGAYRKALK